MFISRIFRALPPLFAALLLAACMNGGGGAAPVPCEGTTTMVEAQSFCVYATVDPGIDCPDELPVRYEHEGHTVCAADEAVTPETLDAAIGGGSAGPTGESCADALVVSSLPFTASGDLVSRSLDHPHDGTGCGVSVGIGRGGDYRDVVFEFAPAVTGDYRWTVESIELHGAFLVTTDCAAIPSACEGGFIIDAFDGGGSRVLSLSAGTTYRGILLASPAVDFSTHPGGYIFRLERI